jgi:non-specific serine/threonine protein kinase
VELVITPHGEMRVGGDDAQLDDPIARAFAKGTGPGLLHLGTAALDADLSASLAFGRRIARAYFMRLGAAADDDTRVLPTITPESTLLAELCLAVPPMQGSEYLTPESLQRAWSSLHDTTREHVDAAGTTLQTWFERHAPTYNTLGHIVFHLAEHKADPERPFAFMASWAAAVGEGARVQHVPLGRAVEQAEGDRKALLTMLRPLAAAAKSSAWTQTMVESRAVYQPRAWTAEEAFAMLREIPPLRAAGITVRMPPGWAQGRPPRARVAAKVGAKIGSAGKSGVGFDAMLDFDVALAIDGEPLSRAEAKALLAGAAGLRQLRGRWIEVDPEQLAETLARYESVQKTAKAGGISFAAALRMLATSTDDDTAGATEAEPWSLVSAGPWLADVFARLRSPEASGAADPGAALHADLRPYQKAGVSWLWTLWSLGTGGCLADDMGLGKTVQVIALFLLVSRARESRAHHIVVAPASLLDNWLRELQRFAPSLRVAIAHASRPTDVAIDDADVVLTTYGTLQRQPELTAREWTIAVIDEAQAIKNPAAKQTRAVKQLRARMRLALTGTPVENRLGDLWSVLDFACPGLLGGAKEFATFTKSLAKRSTYAPLRELCRPWILRRLKSDRRVITDLPDKTELDVACGLSKLQAALYRDAVDGLARELASAEGTKRRGLVLAYLMRLKQICNHPSQFSGDGAWREPDSGKLVRLRELAEEIAARQEKVLVFTQFRETCDPLADHLARVFGRAGLVLHGDVGIRKRGALVEQFAAEDGPPFFVLSLRAGGTGLNLTAASHVIHFDRWWNPAVENQATDRAYRIGQRKNVLVHRFVCRGTIEDKIAEMLVDKRGLADNVLAGDGEVALTELPTDELLRLVRLDVHRVGTVE